MSEQLLVQNWNNNESGAWQAPDCWSAQAQFSRADYQAAQATNFKGASEQTSMELPTVTLTAEPQGLTDGVHERTNPDGSRTREVVANGRTAQLVVTRGDRVETTNYFPNGDLQLRLVTNQNRPVSVETFYDARQTDPQQANLRQQLQRFDDRGNLTFQQNNYPNGQTQLLNQLQPDGTRVITTYQSNGTQISRTVVPRMP